MRLSANLSVRVFSVCVHPCHVRRQFICVHIPSFLHHQARPHSLTHSEGTPIRIPPHTPHNHHTLLPLATTSPHIHSRRTRPTSTPLTPRTSPMLPRRTPRAKILPTTPTRWDFNTFRMETRLMVQRGEVGEVF